MTIALLIPDGASVRNFLLGDFIRNALQSGRVTALHNLPKDRVDQLQARFGPDIEWQPLIPYRDTALSFTLRNALVSAHMYYANTRAMKFNLRLPVNGSWRTRSAVSTARVVGRAIATLGCGFGALEHLHRTTVDRSPEVSHYLRLFNEYAPSVLFCAHQRPPEILPPVLAAKKLKIPTATFIFSWDNLTSKGRIAAPFDHYLVWSDQMRDELLMYYPEIQADRVHVTGTPQFDPYADKKLLWSRGEFLSRIGADANRPLICFSGGDITICPEDQDHVRVLMELIRAVRIAGNPQVLVRPSPVDDGRRYAEVLAEFPEVIYSPPAWVHSERDRWDRFTPLAEDVQFLANLTQHADLNINVASTMTLDFAVRDKPVINIAFDVGDPPPFGMPLWEHHYKFEHYRPVINFGAARFARSPEELADHVNAYLENPAFDREGRRRFVDLEVSEPLGQAGSRILQVLEKIANQC
jgi:hypothetical protein